MSSKWPLVLMLTLELGQVPRCPYWWHNYQHDHNLQVTYPEINFIEETCRPSWVFSALWSSYHATGEYVGEDDATLTKNGRTQDSSVISDKSCRNSSSTSSCLLWQKRENRYSKHPIHVGVIPMENSIPIFFLCKTEENKTKPKHHLFKCIIRQNFSWLSFS